MDGNRKQRRARASKLGEKAERASAQTLVAADQITGVSLPPDQIPGLLRQLWLFAENVRRANGFYEVAPDKREGPMLALASVITLAQSIGLKHGDTRVFKALFDQLGDLDNGRVGPLVTPTSFGAGGSRPLATARWNARAFLAAALDARVSLYGDVEAAADRVIKDAREAISAIYDAEPGPDDVERDIAAKLIELRKQFRSNRQPGPPDGEHLVAWGECMAESNKSLGSPQRSAVLEHQYATCISQAQNYASQFSPPGN